jgi:pimeloyl-ACP methyl ester carboxylesterase
MRVLIPESADEAHALLDELGIEEFAAVGLGSEGSVAMELALAGGLRAKTLVLLGTPEIPGAELSSLKDLPAFFLWGEDDDVVPPEVAERMANAMDFSTLALIPDCGHNPLESDSATALPLIYEFLRMRYLGRTHGHTSEEGPVKIEILTHPPGKPK